MKRKNIIILAAAFAAMSCSQESIQIKPEGEGSLKLGINMPLTKAAMTSDELESSALVKIYKADFSGLVRAYTYAEAPEVIYLPADQYRVDVIAGEAAKENPAAASWEQKSYKGSAPFEIVAGEQAQVAVEAKVNNAVSKISFDGTVAENFKEGFTFKIGLDLSDETKYLTYDASKSGSEGYFIVNYIDEPALNWEFAGILAKDESEFSKSGSIPVAGGNCYQMNVKFTLKDGDIEFSQLLVDVSTDVVDDVIVFEPLSTGLASLNIFEVWAGHATVHADVDETEYSDPSAIKFAYRAAGTEDWTTMDGVRASEGVYDCVFTGLAGSTQYEYKLVIGGADMGDAKSFTTEAAPQMPNSSFEYVSKISGKDYYKWYDPSCAAAEGQTMFWGSGNGEGSEGVSGSAGMGIVITEPDESDKIDGDRSVRAQSRSILGMLAAGNIFTGNFAGLEGTSGGKVNFGRPWTSRPTAVRLYAKYTADKINILKNLPAGANVTKDDYDRASIQIALGTWDYKKYGGTKESPVHVNTTIASTFVDYNTDASTIANAELILYGDGYEQINDGEKTAASTSEWRQITIPLNYHSKTAYPTHIIVSCAASKYGDYFTGCDTAKLWLDKVELIYE